MFSRVTKHSLKNIWCEILTRLSVTIVIKIYIGERNTVASFKDL